jgi:chromosomal replication initiation ATPase DnaA
VDYDSLWNNWSAEYGGKDPVAGYRRFVEQGVSEGVANPLKEALDDWVIGSQAFLKKIVRMASGTSKQVDQRLVRRSSAWSPAEILQFVSDAYQVQRSEYVGFRSSAPGREVAALLCRQLTSSTLSELSQHFGLEHPDSAANLVRRANKLIASSSKYKKRFEALRETLLKTENQV